MFERALAHDRIRLEELHWKDFDHRVSKTGLRGGARIPKKKEPKDPKVKKSTPKMVASKPMIPSLIFELTSQKFFERRLVVHPLPKARKSSLPPPLLATFYYRRSRPEISRGNLSSDAYTNSPLPRQMTRVPSHFPILQHRLGFLTMTMKNPSIHLLKNLSQLLLASSVSVHFPCPPLIPIIQCRLQKPHPPARMHITVLFLLESSSLSQKRRNQ